MVAETKLGTEIDSFWIHLLSQRMLVERIQAPSESLVLH